MLHVVVAVVAGVESDGCWMKIVEDQYINLDFDSNSARYVVVDLFDKQIVDLLMVDGNYYKWDLVEFDDDAAAEV